MIRVIRLIMIWSSDNAIGIISTDPPHADCQGASAFPALCRQVYESRVLGRGADAGEAPARPRPRGGGEDASSTAPTGSWRLQAGRHRVVAGASIDQQDHAHNPHGLVTKSGFSTTALPVQCR